MKKAVDYIGVSAGAMVFNDKGELFLSKRSQNCKNERGHWETPGGSVELGETLEQAVRREMREEYGAEIEILEQFPAADHLIPAEKQHWVATTFLARFKPGQVPKIMEPDKCDEIGWFSLDRLPSPLSLITQADLKEYAKRKPQTTKTIIVTASEQAWQDAQAAGQYAHSTITSTLQDVGFIHATFPDQTIDMVNRHFKDRDDVMLLFINTENVTSPIKYEGALSGRPGKFPHIYGPLNVAAVFTSVKLAKDDKGNFITPQQLQELL